MLQVNLLDTALIIILLFFGIKGFIRGAVQEIAGLLGFAAGVLLARGFSVQFSKVLVSYGVSPSISSVLAMALLFILGIVLVGLAAHLIRRIFEHSFAGGIDRFFGLLAGFAKGVIFAGIIGYIAVKLFPDVLLVKQSQVVPPLMRFLQVLTGSIDLHIPTL
jgi:membrane protein required for colicin V production